jgi:AraC-like DNA-binding protein
MLPGVQTLEFDSRVSGRDRAVLRRVNDLGGLEVMSASFVDHAFARHTHEEYFVGVIESGAKTFLHHGSAEVVGVGGLSLVNPGEVHTGRRSSGERLAYRAFYPSQSLLESLWFDSSNANPPLFVAPVVHDPDLAKRFLDAFYVLETSTDRLERESKLFEAFTALLGRYAQPGKLRAVGRESCAVRLARQHLDQHWSEPLGLFELAHLVGLSAFYLSRVFKRELGLSPFEYQTQRRIMRSKHLLSHGVSIAQVALEVGYADQSNFTKQFKRLTGVTPKRYATL